MATDDDTRRDDDHEGRDGEVRPRGADARSAAGSIDHHAELRKRDRVDGSFPPSAGGSKPRAVTGGIRAQTRRGRFGATWWGQRFLAPFEAIAGEDRLATGRRYARAGQVVQLDVHPGAIAARVQGSRRDPYEVRIELAVVEQLDWLRVAGALAARAVYRARLQAGEVPDDLEAVFAREGLTLFPRLEADLAATCSCSDWSPWCRHVAAVAYLACEAVDRDPFVLLRLRGMERKVLLTLIGGSAPDNVTDTETAAATDISTGSATGIASLTVAGESVDIAAFWSGRPTEQAVPPPDLTGPPSAAPLVRMLGPLPLWRGAADFEPTMRLLLGAAARRPASDVALGDPWPLLHDVS